MDERSGSQTPGLSPALHAELKLGKPTEFGYAAQICEVTPKYIRFGAVRIQLWSYNYDPEPTGIGPVSAVAARGLRDRGHEVDVVCAHPHYPEPLWGRPRLPYREHREGIPILRLPLWVGRASTRERYRQELSFMAAQFAALPWLGRPELIVSVSPSFPALLPAMLNARVRGIPWMLWLQDILPDGAASTGLIDSGGLLRAARALELRAYERARVVVVPSRVFIDNLVAKGVLADKIALVHNPATRSPSGPSAAGDGRRSLRILSMGNIGHSQGLEPLVGAFERSSAVEDRGIELVITGSGVAAADVRRRIESKRVTMPGLVDDRRLEAELRRADVALVSQSHEGAEFNVPSKLMNYMAYGLPVLAVVRPGSEVARLIEESGAGWVVDSSRPERFPETAGETEMMAGQNEGALDERVVDGRASWRPARLTRQFGRTRAQGAIPEGTPEATVLRRDALYRRALAAVDVLAAAAAVVLGVVVIGDDALTPLALLAWPLIVVAGKTVGLYDRDEHLLRKTTLEEAPRLFHLATLYALGLWLAGDLIVSGSLGREQVLGVWAFLFVAMVLARTGVRRLVSRLVPEERCLVLGDSEASDHLAKKLRVSHSLKATVVGRVPFEDGDDRTDGEELGSMATLGAVLARHDVQRVIIAPGTAGSDAILDAIRVVKALGVKVSLLPRLFEVVGSSVEFDDVDGTMVLGLRRRGLTNSSYVLKRATDVVGAIAGLTLVAPVLLAIALAVRTTSPGPILFRQTRTGRRGGEFRMLKFRTMFEEADGLKAALRHLNEASGVFKLAEDPRTTRVGRFLRRTSLDELPQLFNVLRGDMSLVGPRPLVLDEDQLVHGWGRGRLAVAPGMTGLWQIFGSSRIPLEEMVKIDYLYVANWSLWLDVKILLRTVPYVLSARGL